MADKTQNNLGRVTNILILFMQIIAFCIAAYLTFFAIRLTYYPPTDHWTPIELKYSPILWQLLAILGVIIILIILNYFFEKTNKQLVSTIILISSIFILAIVSLVYLSNHPYYPSGDQLIVSAAAYYFHEGNYIMLTEGGYISMYAFQKGLVFLYELLFSIVGFYRYDIVALLNVIFVILTLVFGYLFLKENTSKEFIRVIYCLLFIGCAPIIIYIPYVYGDIPTICFITILFYCLCKWEKTDKLIYILFACIAAILALFNRTNSWIALIAIMIVFLLLSIKRGSIKPIIIGLCIILSGVCATKAVDRMYEVRSGIENCDSIPKILWIAMGMQENDGIPGMYNYYQQETFQDYGYDAEFSAYIGKEYIKERLLEFSQNKDYAYYFYNTKIKTQWLEPLFGAFRSTSTYKDEEPTGMWLSLYYGDLHDAVWNFSDYYQTIVYLGFALALLGFIIKSIKGIHKINLFFWAPCITIIGGMLFSIIWENQGRYVFPYYVLILMYAAVGINSLISSKWC